MRLIHKSVPFLLAGIVVAFLWGLFQLFDMVFERGDTYPPYSSFRSDPLGTRALYEATKSLGGLSVGRNLDPLTQLPEGRGKTLFFCGSNLSEDPEDLIKALEDFAGDGGRLVITFFPVTHELFSYSARRAAEKKKEKPKDEKTDEQTPDGKVKGKKSAEEKDDEASDKDDEKESEPWFTPFVSIEDRWGFVFASLRPRKSKKQELIEVGVVRQEGPDWLPKSLPWHSALYFDKLSPNWKVMYSWDGHAVVVERPWVRGTIVLCSDSYLLSNEAMRNDRHPELMAWLIGASPAILFDETHLGIQEEKKVMTLVRKYGMDRPLAVIILLALLFVWKNAVSLVPKQPVSDSESVRQGKDATAGLVNLLRRSIPSHQILSVCFDEWKRASARDPKVGGKREHVQQILVREMALPPRKRDPVRIYQTISAVLTERD